MWVAVYLVLSCCGLLLVHNARPDLFDFGILPILALFNVYTLPFTLGVIFYVLHKLQQDKLLLRDNPVPLTVMVLTIMLTIILMVAHVPTKIAFAASHAQFENLLDDLPDPREWGPTSVNSQAGWFFVEDYEIDEQNRIYLRVHSTIKLLDVDVTSHGFCYTTKNNCLDPSNQIDYGRADYKAYKVREGWYWFRVSDDW